jgi:hypothetical protein
LKVKSIIVNVYWRVIQLLQGFEVPKCLLNEPYFSSRVSVLALAILGFY